MSTRLDLVLQKYPDHEDGIRVLAERDPSGNLKYLAWGAKMLAAEQALAPEIADVLDLFHRFAGQWLERTGAQVRRARRLRQSPSSQVHPDINTYRPQDFARLRDFLLKIKRAQDKKRKERERLYRIEGSIEADVVYDSDDPIVRHIKNKTASIHYGHDTKWCISMLRNGYFEGYETHNATFFFFERKKPLDDEFDKVALMLPRSHGDPLRFRDKGASAFNALDQRVDMFLLASVHGPRIFDIFRLVYEASARYPGSVLFHAFAGTAPREQLETVFASLVKGDLSSFEADAMLEAIVCNDAAPPAMLEGVLKLGVELSSAAWRNDRRRGNRRRWYKQGAHDAELTRKIMAALVIHPETPGELRVALVKNLRRRHVTISEIRRVVSDGRVGVEYRKAERGFKRRRYRRIRVQDLPVGALRSRVRGLERRIVQAKKAIKKRLEKDKKKDKKKAARMKKE